MNDNNNSIPENQNRGNRILSNFVRKGAFVFIFILSINFLIGSFSFNRIIDNVFLNDGLEVTSEIVQVETLKSSYDAILMPDPMILGVPNDTIYDCLTKLPPVPNSVTATSACGIQSLMFNSRTIDSLCTDKKTILRIWIATDNCSMVSRDTQVIIIDNAFVIRIFQDSTFDLFNCDSDYQVYAQRIRTYGTCNLLSYTFRDDRMFGICDNQSAYMLSIFLRDRCGNIFSASKMVEINDTLPPIINNVPPDVSFTCASNAIAPILNLVSASDNCGSMSSLQYSRIVVDSLCPSRKTIKNLWIARDLCNNVRRDSQIYRINDSLPPTMTDAPIDVTLQCAFSEPLGYSATTLTATDNCGILTLIYARTVSDSTCNNKKTVKHLWVAMDSCMNMTKDSQIVVINDTTNPVINSIPANITIQCASAAPINSISTVAATDNCGIRTLIYARTVSDSTCNNKKTVKHLWVAMDSCMNARRDSQIVVINDTTNPVINSIPANITIQCASAAPIHSVTTVTATDNCGIRTLIYARTVSDSTCDNKKTIKHLWVAMDSCMNARRDSQIVVVNDTTNPVINSIPANITIQCASSAPINSVSTITAMDNCGILSLMYVRTVSDSTCNNKKTIKHLWVAMDNCMNARRDSQIVVINDTTNPVINSIPANITIQCASAAPINSVSTVTATDNCGIRSLVYTRTVSDSICNNKKTIKHLWVAMDSCMNARRDSQIVVVNDNMGPILSIIPANVTIQCASVAPNSNRNSVTATDNCGASTLNYSRILSDSTCINRKTIKHLWIFSDVCGNITRDSQVITVNDNTIPIITGVPADITVTTLTQLNSITHAVTTSDNCGVSTLVKTRVANPADSTCQFKKVILHIWTATDNCGNLARDTQIVVVLDTMPPVITPLTNVDTVECARNFSFSFPTTAVDNFDGVVPVTFTIATIDSLAACNYKRVLILTASDQCSNIRTLRDTVHVLDTNPPLIDCPGLDTVNVACDADLPMPFTSLNAFLGAGGSVLEPCCLDSTTFTLAFEQTSTVGLLTYHTRVYTVTDCCGNVGSCTSVYRTAPCLADLALVNDINGVTPFIVTSTAGLVPLTIRITNEFDMAMDSIVVVNYLPSPLSQVITSGWTPTLGGKSYITLSIANGRLPVGGLTFGSTMTLTFDVMLGFDLIGPIYKNYAEIVSQKDLFGNDMPDLDSTSDDIFGNDAVGNPADGQTEDDFDDAEFFYCPELVCNSLINMSLDENCQALVDVNIMNPLYTSPTNRLELRDINGVIIPGNLLTSVHVGQRIKASVFGPEICGLNSCWGYIFVEDKLAPKVTAPGDSLVYCTESILPVRTGNAVAMDCSPFTLEYRDSILKMTNACLKDGDTLKIISRVFIAKDKYGNIGRDTQIIYVRSLLDSLIKNPSVTVTLNCGQGILPSDILATNGIAAAGPYFINPLNGMPTLMGIQEQCNFAAAYTDGEKLYETNSLCPGTYKFIRHWTITNWCTGLIKNAYQIFKLQDITPPTVEVSAPSRTFNVSVWECSADITLPMGRVVDACDATAKVVAIDGPLGVQVREVGGKWYAIKVPKGESIFRYIAKDCSGNLGTTDITINVVDRIQPVAVSKTFITLSLAWNPDSIYTGLAKLTPENINNFSYDNCSDVYLEIRREDTTHCGNIGLNGHNNNGTFNARANKKNQVNQLHPADSANDTDFGQFVYFCCEDIGKDIKVTLRVWDDGDMNGIFGTEGDNYSETWTNVKVEDKSIPTLTCKPDISVACDRIDVPVYLGADWQAVGTKINVNLLPSSQKICSGLYDLEFIDRGMLSSCNTTSPNQPVLRTYRLKSHPTVSCTQKINFVNLQASPVLDYPYELVNWNKCTLSESDVLTNTLLATNASINVDKGWGNQIAYDGLGLPRKFDASHKNIGCNLFGRKITITEYVTHESCKKWIVTFDYINWCDLSQKAFRSTTYKYDDKTPPTIVKAVNDTISYNGAACVAVWTPDLIGEDENDCWSSLKWKLSLTGTRALTLTGVGAKPNINAPNLSAGSYSINVELEDGCGNITKKKIILTVLGKKPTPYCVSLHSAVMKNGAVELWAQDFDKGSFPNCLSITSKLYFTFNNEHPVWSKILTPHFFKGKGEEVTSADTLTLYANGEIQKWIPKFTNAVFVGGSSARPFGCKVGNGKTFPTTDIIMTVWDELFNSDFCIVSLNLVDNQSGCGSGSLVSLSGRITTELDTKMQNVTVVLKSRLPEFPVTKNTDAKGEFTFVNLPIGAEYIIQTDKIGDYLNGVNTLDLLYIQRHILSLNKLNSPYKMIAADVDGDGKINVADLVILRQLILGVIQELPNAKSWKFVDQASPLTTSSPWPFAEIITHASLRVNSVNNDFVGIKMGDVDGSATVSLRGELLANRSASSLNLEMDDIDLVKGETYQIPVFASNFDDISAFQWTMEGIGLTLQGVNGALIDINKNNVGLINNNTTTLSWNGTNPASANTNQALFSIAITAIKDGKLSEMIKLSSSVTPKLSFKGQNYEAQDVKLSFRSGAVSTFELKQNEPNPWSASTLLKFTLPATKEVTLTVYTLEGKIIESQTFNGKKGGNQIELNKKDMKEHKGLLLFKLEAGGNTATRKMFLID